MTSGNAGIDDQISGIRARYFAEPGAGGVERELSDLADRAVAEAWAMEPAGGWAALAVGGYGRQALHPGSDLDILFFSPPPRRDPEWVDRMVARLAKIPFPAEGDAALESDFAGVDPLRAFIYGAYLDARFLFGDRDIARTFTDRVVPAFVERNRRRLIQALIWRRQTQRAGPSVGLDLKNGRGGLADHRWIRWIGLLAPESLRTPSEAARADDAARFLRSVRTALHWIAGGREDILDEANGGEVARALGIGSAARLLAECRAACGTIVRVADEGAANAAPPADYTL